MATHRTASKPNGKRRSLTKSPKKAAASRRTKSGGAKREPVEKIESVGDAEVIIDRRRGGRRGDEDQSSADLPERSSAGPALERRQKVNRRRQIDPPTCERDYTEHEVEFMNALDDYKRRSGRMFPTCSEVLEVIRSLGYAKVGTSQAISCSAEPFVVPADTASKDATPQVDALL